MCVAEIAPADVDDPSTMQDRIVQGVGTAQLARVIAHAEGAERYAISDRAGSEIVWARTSEQPGAVDPAALYAMSARQRADGTPTPTSMRRVPGARRSPGTAGVAGYRPKRSTPRSRRPRASTPGSRAAARGRRAPARRRGTQARVLRADRTRRVHVDVAAAGLARADRPGHGAPTSPRWSPTAARDGWATHWVNLSLETLPVLLCAMTHDARGLVVGAACDGDPAEALRHATRQALILALRFEAPPGPRCAARVRSPRDHLLLHLDPQRHDDNAFLYASDDEIALADVPSVTAESPEDPIEAIGIEPLVVDLTGPASSPYVVVRALAPGLVPIAFGWDREPLGLQAVSRPRRTVCGRIVGTVRNGGDTAARLPHPFP